MNNTTTFDTLWNRRAAAAAYRRCPLTQPRLDQMMAFAMSREEAPAAGRDAEPAVRNMLGGDNPQPRRSWLFAPLAAAAALALLLIPTRSHAATPHTVHYDGQQVKFLCNHQCEADGVIESLDDYIHTL